MSIRKLSLRRLSLILCIASAILSLLDAYLTIFFGTKMYGAEFIKYEYNPVSSRFYELFGCLGFMLFSLVLSLSYIFSCFLVLRISDKFVKHNKNNLANIVLLSFIVLCISLIVRNILGILSWSVYYYFGVSVTDNMLSLFILYLPMVLSIVFCMVVVCCIIMLYH